MSVICMARSLTTIFIRNKCISCKILTLNQPSYLTSLVKFNIAPRSLRSSAQHLLYLPRTRTVSGGRAFNSAAPKIWNSLPISIRSSPSIASFKQQLKTFYFFSFSLTLSFHAGAPCASDSGLWPRLLCAL